MSAAIAKAMDMSANKYSIEEYFALEKKSDIRHEFVNGNLIPMPGESKIANQIARNCEFLLFPLLKAQGFQTYRHDVRAMIRPNKVYRYPDVMVAPKSDNADNQAVTRPALIIEVTSEQSAKIDHEDKLKEYTALHSLNHYLIISQSEYFIASYTRENGHWIFDVFTQKSSIVPLKHLGISISLSDIYDDIDLEENEV
jgi:Uma2 family endonuclease